MGFFFFEESMLINTADSESAQPEQAPAVFYLLIVVEGHTAVRINSACQNL